MHQSMQFKCHSLLIIQCYVMQCDAIKCRMNDLIYALREEKITKCLADHSWHLQNAKRNRKILHEIAGQLRSDFLCQVLFIFTLAQPIELKQASGLEQTAHLKKSKLNKHHHCHPHVCAANLLPRLF